MKLATQFRLAEMQTFNSDDIEVGQDSAAAGNGNVTLGTLTIFGADTGTADVTEDDSTFLAGVNNTGRLALTSADDISNTIDASIVVDQVQFNANDEVRIGNQTGDNFASHGSEIQLGVVTVNASITANDNIQINGNVPIDATINQPHSVFVGDPFQLGTSVDNTLFVESQTGYIETEPGKSGRRQPGIGRDQPCSFDRRCCDQCNLCRFGR